MKKREFFVTLVAGAAIAVAAQAFRKWFWGEVDEDDFDDEFDDEDDCECDECEEAADEALDALLNDAYDEGFADGINGDYQGFNPAAQVLQAKVDMIRDEYAAYECENGDGDEYANPEDAEDYEDEE